jgi:hypothetical protein
MQSDRISVSSRTLFWFHVIFISTVIHIPIFLLRIYHFELNLYHLDIYIERFPYYRLESQLTHTVTAGSVLLTWRETRGNN